MAGYNNNYAQANHLAYASGKLFNSDTFGSADGGPVYYSTVASPSATTVLPNGRHTNGANYVMGDGHAKFLMPGSVGAGWPGAAPGTCGTPGGNAPSVDCTTPSTLAATFSIN
jgi:prepilin-type processing-associated H-X9-DG protein